MKKQIILGFIFLLVTTYAFAQNGVTINQSENIKELMEVKKEFAKDEKVYQIQIYNGTITGANGAHATAKAKLEIPSSLTFETPNYKVRVGAFRTRLEAEKALVEVKKTFPAAFILSPFTN